jgi:hypothetical protein
MAERRTLAAGIAAVPNADPEEVRGFVARETRRDETAPPDAAGGKPPVVRVAPPRGEPQADPGATAPPVRRPRSHGVRPVAPVPVTVRLRPEVAGALKRASLERQLAGEDPFTQQDLVECLLEPWLREQGYLQ